MTHFEANVFADYDQFAQDAPVDHAIMSQEWWSNCTNCQGFLDYYTDRPSMCSECSAGFTVVDTLDAYEQPQKEEAPYTREHHEKLLYHLDILGMSINNITIDEVVFRSQPGNEVSCEIVEKYILGDFDF
jgi:hypothetical protein